MIGALITTLCLAGISMTLLGIFVFIQLLRSSNAPADASNRINRIRLVWFALTRPELFVREFEWLKHDELDNIKANKKD